MRFPLAAAAFLFASLLGFSQSVGKWNLAWFHDELDSSLRFRGIQFTSERTGYALADLTDRRKGKSQPVLVITRDGGSTWQISPLKDKPFSLTCRPEDICWLAAGDGVYQSEEGGRAWRKISGQKGILKLHFTSPTQGWAGGLRHQAWQTSDGGKSWTPVGAAAQFTANPDHSSLHALTFTGPLGIIAGNSTPPRYRDSIYPDWMEPEQVASRREVPGTLLLLETRDGGRTWAHSSASVFGTLTSIDILPEGEAIALLEFKNNFRAPSEILRINFKDGATYTIHQDKSLAVTSLLPGPSRSLLLAGVELSSLRPLGVPGKVVMLQATLEDRLRHPAWVPVPVDYRATAASVYLASTPSGRAWAVTDTGMILRLDSAPPAP